MGRLWLFVIFIPAIVVLFCFILRYIVRYFVMVLGKYYPVRVKKLVLLTHNSQRRIEWSIWSYNMLNNFRRRKSSITCLDFGSTDDTLAILDRLCERYSGLDVIRLSSMDDEEKVISELLENSNAEIEKRVVLDLREGDVSEDSERHLA